MDWQQVVSLIIVAAAAVFLVRGEIRKRRLRKVLPCAGDCHCAASRAAPAKASKRR